MVKLIILIVFGINFLHGQAIEFQLLRQYPCDSFPVTENQYYYLTDIPYNIEDDVYSVSESGTVTVPKPGKYMVHRVTELNVNPYEVELRNGRNVEKVADTKIVQRLSFTLNPYFYYLVCGKLADGYEEDFYPNGRVRIRGNFKEGKALDSIAEYYDNGNYRKTLFYKRKEAFLTEYDSLGKRKHFRWSVGRNCAATYCSFKEIWYGDDEMPMYEFSDIDHIIKIEERYPNGSIKLIQKKKSRVEHYRNGKIKNEYVWRTKRQSGRYIHRIKYKQFDENGKLIAEEFEEDRSDFPQPEIAYTYDNPFYE